MHKSVAASSIKKHYRLRLRFGCGVLLSTLAVILVWSSPAPALTQSPVSAQAQPTIAAGYTESSAIKADGSLWFWGSLSEEGSDEDGSALVVPTRLGTDNTWAAVSAGMFAWYALKTDGSLWTLGSSSETPLGGSPSTDIAAPVRIGTEGDWTTVSVGMFDSLALKEDGSLWCLDSLLALLAVYGGDSTNDSVSARVGMDSDWVAVSAGQSLRASFLLALKKDGSLWSVEVDKEYDWDAAPDIVLISATYNVVRVGTDNDWAAAFAGGGGALALKNDGSLWWVSSEYVYDEADDPESDNTGAYSYEVGRIGTDSDWAVASTSGPHVLAIKTDGSLWAFGYNDHGQLGDGTTTFRETPTRIGTSNKWRAVSAGLAYSLALRSDGTLWAWGDNSYAQLGDGTHEGRYTPVQVLTGVRVPQWSGDGGSSVSFSDVAGSPYEAAIYDLAERGVTTGLEDGAFHPNDPVTRQQFAKMIVKAMLYPVTGSEVCPFTDVPAQIGADPLYPSKYVAVCAQQGITHGATATTFNPESTITREQLITMVVRAAALSDPPPGYVSSFTSSQFSLEEHYGNARRAAYAGILSGLQGVGPSYDFGAACTRGECAQLLHNLLDLL